MRLGVTILLVLALGGCASTKFHVRGSFDVNNKGEAEASPTY